MHCKTFLAPICLAALLTSSMYAAESTYKYQVLAQSGSVIDGITLTVFQNLAMNDFDTVVFEAEYGDGSYAGASGLFTQNHALLKKGDVVRGLTVGRPLICGINDFDELALTFSYGTGTSAALGKFIKHGESVVPQGKLVKTGDVIDGLTIQSFRECAINDVGEVVFSANYRDASGAVAIGVFTRSRVLLQMGSKIKGIPLSGNNYFNRLYGLSDFGTLVFDTFGTLPNLGGTQTGAFTQHDVLALPGETIHGVPLLTAFSPVISHFGRVALTGEYAIEPNCNTYSCFGFAVFTRAGPVVKTGDTISGITLTDSMVPVAINDEDVVLMEANFSGGYGLFTNDAVVAATGDTLGGVQVEGFVNSQLNDSGDVAFSAFESVILAKHCKTKEKHK